MLLQVVNLHTVLSSSGGDVHAVQGVDLHIDRGETLCLVGESGSGKSVTALSIMRLLPMSVASHPHGQVLLKEISTTGCIDLLQQDNTQMSQIRGTRMAMIFQEPMSSLNPVFTIGEQIAEALQLNGDSLSDADARSITLGALRDVQIDDPESRIDDYPHRLSGGQRQRVMIAMALACNAELLIADEPTTALDVTVQAEILWLIKKLKQTKQLAVLFITHDLGVVAQIADRVAVMKDGQIVEYGYSDDVLYDSRHDYTRKLIQALPENLPIEHRPQVSNDVLLETRKLQVHFPVRSGLFRRVSSYTRAVDDVSLKIHRGEILALVGESGSGKSTLGRAIVRLLKPTGGSVLYKNHDIGSMSATAMRPLRSDLQIVFQDPLSSLNPRLTIATTLTEPMSVHNIGESRDHRIHLAENLLREVNLPVDYLWRYPHEFSGGQRQRIGIARALAVNPNLIVCDEITSALDVSVQAEILQLLLDLRRQHGLTLLFITHNISVVEHLSDRTAVMYQGKIIESGSTATICSRPAHSYTQALLEAVPRFGVNEGLGSVC